MGEFAIRLHSVPPHVHRPVEALARFLAELRRVARVPCGEVCEQQRVHARVARHEPGLSGGADLSPGHVVRIDEAELTEGAPGPPGLV